MESREEFMFQELAAQLKQETGRLTDDRLLEAEGRTEEAEARLCTTWHEIVMTVRRLRQAYGAPL
jgi:uncharacterized protein YjbJ (UPF0337 family)